MSRPRSRQLLGAATLAITVAACGVSPSPARVAGVGPDTSPAALDRVAREQAAEEEAAQEEAAQEETTPTPVSPAEEGRDAPSAPADEAELTEPTPN